MSLLSINIPSAPNPSIISDLASAISKTLLNCAKCASPTFVITAISGFNNLERSEISPAWFIPNSNTPYLVQTGILAIVSGKPHLLLYDLSDLWVSPKEENIRAKASFTLVFPTLPVTATLSDLERSNAAFPRSHKASKLFSTITVLFEFCLADRVPPAPFFIASSINSCPSRTWTSGTKRSPFFKVLVSIEMP